MAHYVTLSNDSITQIDEDDEMDEKSHRLLPNNTTSNMRIVTEKQCNTMKKNCLLLLKEYNEDEHRALNRQEFIQTYKKILPNSEDIEIEKLFDFIDGDSYNNAKTVSFHQLLNDAHNFLKLLYSMGCTHSDQHNDDDEDDDSYTDTDVEEEEDIDPTPSPRSTNDISKKRKAHVKFKIPPLEEHTMIPQLSWKHTVVPFLENRSVSIRSKYSGSGAGSQKHERNASMNSFKTMKNVNMYNYAEYIKYQKEQIMELKHKLTELNRYEIKCNELQLILDAKHKEIRNLKEEIKQLHLDKKDYILEMNNMKQEWDELSQKYQDLDTFRKYQEVELLERTDTDEILQQVEDLKSGWSIYKAQSDSLHEEKRKLDRINEQFTEMNEGLRNELQKEKQNVEKLKTLLNTNGEEIRGLTLESMSKDQLIATLQNDIDDLMTQLHLSLTMIRPPSTVAGFGDTDIMDWGYGHSSYNASPRGGENLEFDIFDDLDAHVNVITSQRSVISSSQADTSIDWMKLRTPKYASNANINMWTSASGTSEKVLRNDVVINLSPKKKCSEDEKTYEEQEGDVVLLNRIRSMESELKRYRNMALHDYQEKFVGTRTVGTQAQIKKVGFWDSLFGKIGCVPI